VPTYFDLLGIVAPVFVLLATGWLLRRVGWLDAAADASMLRLGVYVLYPCLIADTILGNPALMDMRNIGVPAVVGGGTVLLGFAVGMAAARLLKLERPHPSRTFAFTTGLFNYGFIPIPIVLALFDRATMGVLFTYTLGVEFALWSVGIALLSGRKGIAGWRAALNAPVLSIIVSLLLNFAHAPIPKVLRVPMHDLGLCAFPVQLILTGASLADLIRRGWQGGLGRNVAAACMVRLVVLPIMMLGVAWIVQGTELQRVAILQAAMPCAMLPVILARHYDADVGLAGWTVIITTAIGLFTIPLWLRVGFSLVAPGALQ
jgi:predicted permease